MFPEVFTADFLLLEQIITRNQRFAWLPGSEILFQLYCLLRKKFLPSCRPIIRSKYGRISR